MPLNKDTKPNQFAHHTAGRTEQMIRFQMVEFQQKRNSSIDAVILTHALDIRTRSSTRTQAYMGRYTHTLSHTHTHTKYILTYSLANLPRAHANCSSASVFLTGTPTSPSPHSLDSLLTPQVFYRPNNIYVFVSGFISPANSALIRPFFLLLSHPSFYICMFFCLCVDGEVVYPPSTSVKQRAVVGRENSWHIFSLFFFFVVALLLLIRKTEDVVRL